MKRNDLIIIIGILAIAGLIYGFNKYKVNSMDKSDLYIEIYVNAKLYERVPVGEEHEFIIETEKGINVIKTHNNGVEMVEASCPDQVCVQTGLITKPGSTIVCLPNEVYIEIVGDTEDGLDAISQ